MAPSLSVTADVLIYVIFKYYVLQGIILISNFASSNQNKHYTLMATSTDNMKAQMRKGMLEYSILLLLQGGDAYAGEIIQGLKNAHLIVVEGTLYPLLTRLKNDDILTYRWEESPSGPPRKYYTLTDRGREVLTALTTAWSEIATSIEILKNKTK